MHVLNELDALHGSAIGRPHRQWPRTLRRSPSSTGVPSAAWHALHPALKAGPERVHRALHSELANRGAERPSLESIAELVALTDAWLRIFNVERPHDSLGRVVEDVFPEAFMSGTFSYDLSA